MEIKVFEAFCGYGSQAMALERIKNDVVDFNYEVSRSLAACEGAILVVDSTQGVEAQTLANVYLALDNDLEILHVINKIDLPSARPDEIKKEIEDIIGIPAMDAPCISAKTGLNVEEVLERIVTDIPAPNGNENEHYYVKRVIAVPGDTSAETISAIIAASKL